MDQTTTVSALKDDVKKFCEERDWDQYHNPKDLAIGITTESAELLDLFRFKSREQSEKMLKNSARARVEEELADVFYFAFRLAQKYNIDVSTALRSKLEENARKYPITRAKGSNKKYTEFEP